MYVSEDFSGAVKKPTELYRSELMSSGCCGLLRRMVCFRDLMNRTI